ncbi:MAG: ABC transporter permease [Actinobacteria bacterium]|jgi:ABC-2 type transport system permease protein|nr:MAG: ABC transporter permease [Actinomycetota bacterium]
MNYSKMFLYEMKMTYREREVIFWMLIFPIALMLILGFVFGSSGDIKLTIGVVDLDGSAVSRAIVEALESIDAIEVKTGSEDTERAELKDDNRNALIVIGEGFGSEVVQGGTGEITMIVNRSDVTTAQITESTVRGIIEEIGREMAKAKAKEGADAGETIAINVEEEQDIEDFEYVDFMVPGVLAIVIMFGGIMGFSEEVAVRREKGILRRVKVSPISLPTFLAAGMTMVVITALIQAVILLLVGSLVFKIKINGNYFYMALVVILGALSFVALGFMISSLTKNSKSAMLAGNAVAMPMMFLSGVFFSIAWVPAAIAVIARMLPLYYLGDALREVMINSASLADIWIDLVVLIGFGLICFGVAVKFFRWE